MTKTELSIKFLNGCPRDVTVKEAKQSLYDAVITLTS